MYAQKAIVHNAHTLHTVRNVHNAHCAYRFKVQSCDCINFVRAIDGACGTGGMLTVADQRIREVAAEYGKKVSIHLYGQEVADETYAIAKSDMLVKGEGEQSNNIFFGSTISNDGFSGQTFDFCLSNEGVIYGLNTGKARNIKEFAA